MHLVELVMCFLLYCGGGKDTDPTIQHTVIEDCFNYLNGQARKAISITPITVKPQPR